MSYCRRIRGVLVIGDAKVSCPATANNPDTSETMWGVTLSMEDDFTVKCDLTTGFVEEDLAASIA